jgi:uncharacterized HAD superfamily protein
MATVTEADDDDDQGGDASRPRPAADATKARSYEDFLLAEYASISQAHFNTNTAIGAFFKNYLAIVGIPMTIVGVLFSYFSKSGSATVSLPDYAFAIHAISWLVGAIGLCVMLYVINLRLDALLYARHVNGIRQYFSNRFQVEVESEFATRVLPRSISLPRYFELAYFVPVITVFALLDTFYPLCASFALDLARTGNAAFHAWPLGWLWRCLLFFLLHFVLYYVLVRHRETAYLRSSTMGIDIDGVLNLHREHFCDRLRLIRRKHLAPASINVIPVHSIPGTDVTEDDEKAVFNDPSYWSEMPVFPSAPDWLERIKSVLGYKIVLFTRRPWPNRAGFPQGQEREFDERWDKIHHGASQGRSAIEELTHAWLHRHGIRFDNVTVEVGKSPELTRFALAQQGLFRVFVEDDLGNATKLARHCDLVFLVNHPYNQANGNAIPNNIIRVSDWREIYQKIDKLF